MRGFVEESTNHKAGACPDLPPLHAEQGVTSFVFEQGDANGVGGLAVNDEVRKVVQADTAKDRTLVIEGESRRAGLDGGECGTELSFKTIRQISAAFRLVVGDGVV